MKSAIIGEVYTSVYVAISLAVGPNRVDYGILYNPMLVPTDRGIIKCNIAIDSSRPLAKDVYDS